MEAIWWSALVLIYLSVFLSFHRAAFQNSKLAGVSVTVLSAITVGYCLPQLGRGAWLRTIGSKRSVQTVPDGMTGAPVGMMVSQWIQLLLRRR